MDGNVHCQLKQFNIMGSQFLICVQLIAYKHIMVICLILNPIELRIGSCLACVYRVMDARGKFGEHERSVRVARGDSREQL